MSAVTQSNMWLVYVDDNGNQHYQPWQDVAEVGTLIDAESGDDMSIVGWTTEEPTMSANHDALTTLITTALALAHGHGESGVIVDYRSPLAEALAIVDSPSFREQYGIESDWTSGDPLDDGEPITWLAPR